MLGAEGAIVSHSIAACARQGYAPLADWPDDAAHERSYTDRVSPTRQDLADAQQHKLLKYAILVSFQQQLEYLAQGYPVQTGMPVTQGWLQTDAQGVFRQAGAWIGGHATVTIGYDLDTGWMTILNSWEGWGQYAPDEPRFASTGGYSNVGYMPMEDYEKMFSDRYISQGTSEAVVANRIGGTFDLPLISVNWADLYAGGALV